MLSQTDANPRSTTKFHEVTVMSPPNQRKNRVSTSNSDVQICEKTGSTFFKTEHKADTLFYCTINWKFACSPKWMRTETFFMSHVLQNFDTSVKRWLFSIFFHLARQQIIVFNRWERSERSACSQQDHEKQHGKTCKTNSLEKGWARKQGPQLKSSSRKRPDCIFATQNFCWLGNKAKETKKKNSFRQSTESPECAGNSRLAVSKLFEFQSSSKKTEFLNRSKEMSNSRQQSKKNKQNTWNTGLVCSLYLISAVARILAKLFSNC